MDDNSYSTAVSSSRDKTSTNVINGTRTVNKVSEVDHIQHQTCVTSSRKKKLLTRVPPLQAA